MSRYSPHHVWAALKRTVSQFSANDSFRHSAALAYTAVFSLPPLLIVVIAVAGVVFGHEAVSGQVFGQLRGLLGADAAAGIQKTILNFNRHDAGPVATAVGIGTLVVGATTFFATLQESLNAIWNLKPKPRNGLLQWLRTRVLSLGLVLSVGLLLLTSLVLSAGLAALSDYLRRLLPDVTVVLFFVLDLVLSVGLITGLFTLLFRYLPDARLAWRDVVPGAFITALLFVLGKYLIGLYISKADPGSAYGAAGSIIVLLVWVYYSSLLVFFGAEFTQEWLARFGEKIQPKEYAVGVVEKELPPGQPAPVTKDGTPAERRQPETASRPPAS